MDAIFMNSENSKTSKPPVLVLKLNDKLVLRKVERSVSLSNLSIYFTWKNIKSSYKIIKLKRLAPTWSDEFELPGGSYSISDVQDYFKYILKKHGENIDNPSVKIYVNKIENRITFKIKIGYYLELLTPFILSLYYLELLTCSSTCVITNYYRCRKICNNWYKTLSSSSNFINSR